MAVISPHYKVESGPSIKRRPKRLFAAVQNLFYCPVLDRYFSVLSFSFPFGLSKAGAAKQGTLLLLSHGLFQDHTSEMESITFKFVQTPEMGNEIH